MRPAAVLLAAAAVVALTAGRAAAATNPGVGYLFGYPLSATHVVQSDTPILASGEIVVRFHPDPAGCAQLDHCAFSGTTIYRFADGDLAVTSYRLHGHQERSIGFELGLGGPGNSGDLAYTRVSRVIAGQPTTVCADGLPAGGSLAAHPMGSRVGFDLAGALPQPRCAGPLPSDLSGALPRLTMAIPAHRGTRVILNATQQFTAGGFAGTVSSTLALRIGRSTTTSLSRTTMPPHGHFRRVRLLERTLTVTAEHGAITLDLRGTPDANVCVLLDSCGLSGTLTLTPGLVGAQGSLFTIAPVSRPRSDLVAALSGRGGRGLPADGMLFASASGTLGAALGGPVTCSDRGPLAPGMLSLGPLGARLPIAYSLGSAATSRTRCPGPELPVDHLAAASIPRSALAARSFQVTLSPGSEFTDDGYIISPHGQVILTLRPGGFTERVLTAATG